MILWYEYPSNLETHAILMKNWDKYGFASRLAGANICLSGYLFLTQNAFLTVINSMELCVCDYF